MRFCLVRVCVDTPRDVGAAHAFLSKLANTFDFVFSSTRNGDDSVTLSTGNVGFHVYSNNPVITKVGQLLGRGPLSVVTGVAFGGADPAGGSKLVWSNSTRLVLTNSPLPPPPPSTQRFPPTASVFKEICIPAPTESLRLNHHAALSAANSFESLSDCPGVYSSKHISPRLDVRLFPALKVGLTLLSTRALIVKSPLAMSKLGSQLHCLYQLHLPEPLAQAFSLQVTDSPETHSFYSEGTDAVLDGTIPSLQSSRVVLASSDDDDKVDPRIGSGNCWQEVREMAKRPSKIADSR